MPKATKKVSTAARDRRLRRVKDSFGPALKKARRIRHLTLHELADRIGCSPSALSKIENQKAAPSFSMVYAICRALRMDVTTLLENPTSPRAIVTKAGRHTVFHTTGMEFQALVQATPEHRMEVHVVDIAPGAHSGAPMGHGPGEVVGLVFEGTLKLTVDGKTAQRGTRRLVRLFVRPASQFRQLWRAPHARAVRSSAAGRLRFAVAWHQMKRRTPPALAHGQFMFL